MKRAAYLLLTVVGFFLLVELALRSAQFEAPATVLDYRLKVSGELHGAPHPTRFWYLPGREPNFAPEVYKIVCLADSVTVMDQGEGYPEDLQAALLVEGFDPMVGVFNAGVPEYTSYQGRLYLTEDLLPHKPDLVTIQYGVNDHWRARGGVADKDVRMPDPQWLRRHRMLTHLRSYQAVRAGVLSLTGPDGPGPLRVGVADYRDNLNAMIDDSREAGANVIVVLSPYLDLGHDQDWAPLHRRYNRIAESVAKEKGVPVVDVVDKLRFAPNLFMEPETDQIHFNREAGRMIAERIAHVVVEKFTTADSEADDEPNRVVNH